MNERPDRNDDPEDPFGGYRLDGLYAFGPVGMRCALAAMIYNSLLIVTGSTPEGERKVKVRRARPSSGEVQPVGAAGDGRRATPDAAAPDVRRRIPQTVRQASELRPQATRRRVMGFGGQNRQKGARAQNPACSQ
jgi:hypothetical protein